jgi:hypothetical protein
MAMGRYGSGFAPPRLDPTRLDTRPKKPVYCPAPPILTGTRLTRPDGYPTRRDLFFKGFFQSVSSDPVNVELNQPLDRIWPNHHHRSSEPPSIWAISWIQTRSEPPSMCVQIQFVGSVALRSSDPICPRLRCKPTPWKMLRRWWLRPTGPKIRWDSEIRRGRDSWVFKIVPVRFVGF